MGNFFSFLVLLCLVCFLPDDAKTPPLRLSFCVSFSLFLYLEVKFISAMHFCFVVFAFVGSFYLYRLFWMVAFGAYVVCMFFGSQYSTQIVGISYKWLQTTSYCNWKIPNNIRFCIYTTWLKELPKVAIVVFLLFRCSKYNMKNRSFQVETIIVLFIKEYNGYETRIDLLFLSLMKPNAIPQIESKCEPFSLYIWVSWLSCISTNYSLMHIHKHTRARRQTLAITIKRTHKHRNGSAIPLNT